MTEPMQLHSCQVGAVAQKTFKNKWAPPFVPMRSRYYNHYKILDSWSLIIKNSLNYCCLSDFYTFPYRFILMQYLTAFFLSYVPVYSYYDNKNPHLSSMNVSCWVVLTFLKKTYKKTKCHLLNLFRRWTFQQKKRNQHYLHVWTELNTSTTYLFGHF